MPLPAAHFRPVQSAVKDPYSLPLKWYAPIASVAAVSDRHAGWQYWWHEFNGAMPPICHCEAPKGPWQSRSTRLDHRAASANSQLPSRDCHVASLLAMTHQGNAVVHQRPLLQHPVEKIKNRHQSGFFRSNFSFSVAFAEKIRYDGR